MKRSFFTMCLLIFSLSACIAHHPIQYESRTIAPDKTSSVVLAAKIGDVIYEEGSYDIVKAFEMSNGIDSTMPGSMGLPFGFAIRKTILKPHYQTDYHVYYAAPFEDVLASHTLLGSVIVQGDSVGVRINKKTDEKQWYVDNSMYNGHGASGTSSTIWYRAIKKEDNVSLKPIEIREYRSHQPFKRITFEGVQKDELILDYAEITKGFEKGREYRFEVKSPNQITMITLKGVTLRIHSASEGEIRYSFQ